MAFDDVLKEIGEFGRHQKIIYFFVCIPSFSIGMFLIINVVLLAEPEHRCKLPGLENDTYAVQSEGHLSLINATIPPYDGDEHMYNQCHLYVNANVTYDLYNRPINATVIECQDWVYDTTVFKNTFTKQLNLVCGDRLSVSNVQLAFYFGALIGSFASGQLSDIIGRKKTLFMNTLVLLVSSVGLVFVNNFYLFAGLQFTIGCCCLGTFMCAYVIGMELVGPSKRVWAGVIIHIFGSTGSMYLVMMSYILRDWKYIQLSVGLPCCIFLAYWWILPESARWLFSQGRRKEAEEMLKKAAKTNGVDLQQKTLDSVVISKTDRNSNGFWKLFSTKTFAFRTTVLYINWFVVSMSYYGVLLNVGNLGGDFYLNLFLMAVVEYPAKVFSLFLMDRLGRKKLYIAFMLVGGLANIGTIFPLLYGEGQVSQNLIIALAVIGKMGCTGGFEVIYILSAELFPTVLRNAGIGSSSACARAGSMLAPYIAKSAYLINSISGKAIPLTLFGVASFIAGLLCVTLPETMNRKLPETISDAHNVQRVKTSKPAYNRTSGTDTKSKMQTT